MQLPFKHRIKVFLAFWAITLPAIVVIFPALILAICNPLWFRDDMLIKLQHYVESFAHWRNNLLKPLTSKYDLFNMLTNNNVEQGPTQSPN